MITVTVEPGRVPRVVLSGIDGPVVGRAGGREWVVAGEPGARVVDPLAPLGETFHYEMADIRTENKFLESRVREAISSPGGDLVVECFRENERALELDRGVTALWPKNSRTPWIMQPKVAKAFTGPLSVVVDSVNSEKLVELLEAPTPVVVKHNHARCHVKKCRIPTVQVLTVESATDEYVGQDFSGEVSRWELTVLPDQLTAPVPARTWWHTANENESWFGVDLIEEAFL